MLRNYFRVAFRALRSRPGHTALNVGGLALGLACAFVIALFIRHEASYDRFHEDVDRIHRLTVVRGDGQRAASTAAGLAPLIEAQFPEVERALRLDVWEHTFVRMEDGQTRRIADFLLADEAFFDAFSFPLLRGDPAHALADPASVVLTASTARAHFGDADPIGRTLTLRDQNVLTVTGIAADPPANSTIRFGAVAPFRLRTAWEGEDTLDDLTNWNYNTYLLTRAGTDIPALEAKLLDAVRERFGEEVPFTPALQPLAAVHFTTDIAYDYPSVRDRRYPLAFGAVALFVLLLACVNFVNLATARAAERAKEVGVRKTLGAQRRQLVGQFLAESALVSGAAVVLALAAAAALAPAFNDTIESTARLDFGQPGLLAALVGIGLAAGLLAGAYPALYLSGFQPARVLKGDAGRGGAGARLRQGLIVFQFAVTVFMLAATLTVHAQLRHMQDRDLGFARAQVVGLHDVPPLRGQHDALRQRLLARPEVAAAARGSLPGRTFTNRGYNWPGQAGEEEGRAFWTAIADPDYAETLGLEVVAGRFLSWAEPDVDDAYVLNETAVRLLGWTPEEAVGQPFRAWDRPMGTVVGVVRDYHFQSLHQPVEPLVLNHKPGWLGGFTVRLAEGDVRAGLAALRAEWEALAPGYAFGYTFLDEDFGRLYLREERLGRLFGLFAGIAVLIACLGLLGLAAFVAEQRRKEIGVRKVLGASVGGLVGLLSKDFARLVLVGAVVAVPLAYLAMGRWLEGFAYRITLGPGVFIAAGALALAVALATVAGQALRAAVADPVKALRSE